MARATRGPRCRASDAGRGTPRGSRAARARRLDPLRGRPFSPIPSRDEPTEARARSRAPRRSCRRYEDDAGYQARALLFGPVHHHVREPVRRLVVGVDRPQHLVRPAVLLYVLGERGLPHHDDGVILVADGIDRTVLVPGAVAGELGHLERLEPDALAVQRQEAHELVGEYRAIGGGDDARELAYLPLLVHHVVLKARGDEG